jgi:hypothetical protein
VVVTDTGGDDDAANPGGDRHDGRGVREAIDPSKLPDPDGYLAGMSVRFPSLHVRSWSERGKPGERLCEVAAEERADAIVVGNRGAHGSRWRAHESVPSFVLRRSPCSVFVVDTRAAQR